MTTRSSGLRFTTDNLTAVVLDPLDWTIMMRSLLIAGLVTLATVVAAFPVAHYLAFHAGSRARPRPLPGNAAVLDQLPSARLRLEGHAGLQRRPQFRLVGLGIFRDRRSPFQHAGAVIITLTHA